MELGVGTQVGMLEKDYKTNFVAEGKSCIFIIIEINNKVKFKQNYQKMMIIQETS